VSAFAVDAAGTLRLLANYPSATMTTTAAALDPGARHLFVLGQQGSYAGVFVYGVDAASGGLTPVAGSPFLTDVVGGGARSFAINAGGTRLYVVQAGVISTFSINPSSGVLSASADTPVVESNGFVDLALYSLSLDPQGSFLYVAAQADAPVFALDAQTGNPTAVPGSPFAIAPSNATLFSTVADPVGGFVYYESVSGGAYSFTGYKADPATGALTPIPGGAVAVGGHAQGAYGPYAAIDPSGRFFYAAVGAGVSTYGIAPGTGVLAPVAGPLVTGANASCVVVDPNSRFVYAGGTGSVSVLVIDPMAGTLSPVTGSPFNAGASAPAQPLLVNGLAVTP